MAIETRLVIQAVDETAKAFASVEAKIKGLSRTVGSAAGVVGSTGQGVAAGATATNSLRNAAGTMGMVAGAARAAAGVAVTYGGYMAVREGVKAVTARQHEIVRMAVSGMSAGEIGDATTEALKLTSEMPAVSASDTMHMLRNARSIVGSYKEAAEIAEPLMKLRVLAQLARPGQDVSEDFDQLIKGLEIKGVTQNPAQFREYMEGIAKGINVFGDTLKPYQYYEMFKYGRQATPGLSEKFILGTGPTLAQELGGEGFGAAVAAFNRLLVSGVGKKGSFEELARLGLLDAGGVANIPGTGEGKGIKAGHTVKGWREAQSDPNAWVKDYLLPALDKLGIKDKEGILKEIGVLFQSQRAAQLVDLLATQQARIDKDTALLGNAQGLSAAEQTMRSDPNLAWQGLTAAIENLTATLLQSVNAASGMTSAAIAISHFAADLEAEKAAQDAGQSSPAIDRTNRHLNRLLFGEDTPDTMQAITRRGWVQGDASVSRRFNELLADWDAREEQAKRHPEAAASIRAGQAYDAAEVKRLNDEWIASLPSRGRAEYGYAMNDAMTARAAGRDGPGSPGPGNIGDYIQSAIHQANERVFGGSVSVTGQAAVDQTLHVEISLDPSIQARIDALQSFEFSVPLGQAPTGRMDTDAAPQRSGIGHM